MSGHSGFDRRKTLGVLSDSQLNAHHINFPPNKDNPANSKIPLPTNSARLSIGPRQSLGPASRAPLAPHPTSLATSSIASLPSEFASMAINSSQGNERPSRLSILPISSSNVGRVSSGSGNIEPSRTSTGRPSSGNRRLSAYNRATAAAQAQPAAPLKDPRNIRDKNFQFECIRKLLNFLTLSGYDNKLSQKALVSPSTRDFQLIFKFLYAQLDPTYEYGKTFEDDVPNIVKSLRYPFAGDIKASQLRSVGSIHAWPTVLAMLVWMVDLIESVDKMDPEGGAAETQADDSYKIFYDCIADAYYEYLCGKDNLAKIAELGEKFGEKNAVIEEEIASLEASASELQLTLKDLIKNHAQLPALEKDKSLYSSDIEKYKKFIVHLQQKKEKLGEMVKQLQEQINETEMMTDEMERERAELQIQVDAQQVSPEDIDRMNADCNSLQMTLTSLNASKAEILKIIYEREKLITSRIEMLERIVNEYNITAESLSLVPADAKNARGQNFEMCLNATGMKIDELSDLDISAVHKYIYTLKEQFGTAIYKANDLLHVLADTIDGLEESACDKMEELERMNEKIKKLSQQYTDEKEKFTTENRRTATDIEEREVEILRIKNDASSAYLQSQQLLQKISIEHDTIQSRINEDKDRSGKEILRIIDDLVTFKSHIENSLEEFEATLTREQNNSRTL